MDEAPPPSFSDHRRYSDLAVTVPDPICTRDISSSALPPIFSRQTSVNSNHPTYRTRSCLGKGGSFLLAVGGLRTAFQDSQLCLRILVRIWSCAVIVCCFLAGCTSAVLDFSVKRTHYKAITVAGHMSSQVAVLIAIVSLQWQDWHRVTAQMGLQQARAISQMILGESLWLERSMKLLPLCLIVALGSCIVRMIYFNPDDNRLLKCVYCCFEAITRLSFICGLVSVLGAVDGALVHVKERSSMLRQRSLQHDRVAPAYMALVWDLRNHCRDVRTASLTSASALLLAAVSSGMDLWLQPHGILDTSVRISDCLLWTALLLVYVWSLVSVREGIYSSFVLPLQQHVADLANTELRRSPALVPPRRERRISVESTATARRERRISVESNSTVTTRRISIDSNFTADSDSPRRAEADWTPGLTPSQQMEMALLLIAQTPAGWFLSDEIVLNKFSFVAVMGPLLANIAGKALLSHQQSDTLESGFPEVLRA